MQTMRKRHTLPRRWFDIEDPRRRPCDDLEVAQREQESLEHTLGGAKHKKLVGVRPAESEGSRGQQFDSLPPSNAILYLSALPSNSPRLDTFLDAWRSVCDAERRPPATLRKLVHETQLAEVDLFTLSVLSRQEVVLRGSGLSGLIEQRSAAQLPRGVRDIPQAAEFAYRFATQREEFDIEARPEGEVWALLHDHPRGAGANSMRSDSRNSSKCTPKGSTASARILSIRTTNDTTASSPPLAS